MKTSPATPRTPRKTSSTVARKAAPAEKVKQAAAPRVRRAAPKRAPAAAVDVAAPPPAAESVVSLETVRLRAYEIYLSRNGQGDALSDWLQAEQELFARAG